MGRQMVQDQVYGVPLHGLASLDIPGAATEGLCATKVVLAPSLWGKLPQLKQLCEKVNELLRDFAM